MCSSLEVNKNEEFENKLSPSHVVLKRGGSNIDDGAEPHARRPDLVPGRALFLGKTFFGRNSSRSRYVELDEGHVHS